MIQTPTADANLRQGFRQWLMEKQGLSERSATRVLTDAAADPSNSYLQQWRHDIPASGRLQGGNYTSPHWDVDNPLAHVRLSDRVGPNGEKTLFVEEMQSDWHQAGREQGYFGGPGQPTSRELEEGSTAVPDAPFKRTEDWTGLAWRRVMDEAAAGGYDRVAWTTGAQQNARYALSHATDQIEYEPRAGHLIAWKNGSVAFLQRDARFEDLPGLIGKDATRNLLASPLQPGVDAGPFHLRQVHALNSVDMDVGGEGMKSYYDQIVPKVVQDWAKKHGVSAPVENAGLQTPSSVALRKTGVAPTGAAEASQPSIRITPEIRERLRTRGQNLGAAWPLILGAGAMGGIAAANGKTR